MVAGVDAVLVRVRVRVRTRVRVRFRVRVRVRVKVRLRLRLRLRLSVSVGVRVRVRVTIQVGEDRLIDPAPVDTLVRLEPAGATEARLHASAVLEGVQRDGGPRLS